MLLGSRSGEEWLAKGAFDDNIYDLPGLDDEAASMLADRILEKCRATRYRDDEKENENLRKLIKLLDGFPLAMEVVLANLAKQTPQQILDALQAGDVKIDPQSNNQERTTSILRCIDYSHSNLSPEAQQLLLCLAPFTSVFWLNSLDGYTPRLKQQPILANLPFDRWSEVLREAQNWGLLSPHEVAGYLHMQPTLAYFLRNRLNESGQVEVREAIETAFREHYDEIGETFNQLLESKEPKERQIGQLLTDLEYENLMVALNLGLEAQVSVGNFYFTLSAYLDTTQAHHRGLELGQAVMTSLETYPLDKLNGELGYEFIRVIDDIAWSQLNLMQYADAEASYQKALALLEENKRLEAKHIRESSASIYHQLGMIAQGQRQWQWQQAEQYHQQALQIKIEYNDRYSQARTCGPLGLLAQYQQQWQQASEYLLQALQIFAEYKDDHMAGIALRSLASLWKASDDANVPVNVAKALEMSVEETEKMLLGMLEEQTDGAEKKE